MGGECDTYGLVKEKLKEGTESIKHCTATAEWHDVSNVEWREAVSWDTEIKKIKKRQGMVRKREDRKKGQILL